MNASVDIVIPVFNRERTIAGAVASALGQTHPATNVIVVDDGSTDRTLQVLDRLRSPRLSIVRGDHAGAAAARNRGAAQSTADFVAFLDSDDRLHEQWAELTVGRHPDAGIIGCGGRFVQRGQPPRIRLPERSSDGCGVLYLPGLFVVRRDVLLVSGTYDERLRFGENGELGRRITAALSSMRLPTINVDEVLLDVHLSPTGRSQAENPQRLLDAAELVLEKHQDQFRETPPAAAAYHAIAGVNALRLGRRQLARRHLREATRLRPTARYWARYVQSMLPFG